MANYVRLDGGTVRPKVALKGGIVTSKIELSGGKVYPTGGGSANLETLNLSYTPSETAISDTQTPSAGYDGFDEVNVSVSAIPSNYVGSSVPRKSSSDLTASGATVTAPAGYYENNATKTIPNASAPYIDGYAIGNTGRLVVSMEIDDGGYISGNTYQLFLDGVPVKGAQTYTPGTTDQTIATYQYLTGAQTILGDANLIASNIVSGVTIFGVTGTASGGNLGGLAYMEDTTSQYYNLGRMLECMKKGETTGGTVQFASAFPNTETLLISTGLTTIQGFFLVNPNISIGTNVDSGVNKAIFVFPNSQGGLNVFSLAASNVYKVYPQAQSTVQAGLPLQGAIRINGGDVYYSGRYNQNASNQIIKSNTLYEWIAW